MDSHIDIITAPQYKSFEELKANNSKLSKIWLSKFTEEEYLSKAGFEPEFGKIIGLGYTFYSDGKMSTRIVVKDEETILNAFSERSNRIIIKFMNELRLVGVGIKTFDLPFLCRRYILNNKPLPKILQTIITKKPYELSSIILDLSEQYGSTSSSKFGKNIDAISAALNIETESEHLGSDMLELYLNEDYESIEKYLKSNINSMVKIKEVILDSINYNWKKHYEEEKEGNK